MEPSLFAELILPLPLPGSFTYSIPPSMAETVVPGVRVLVQFGAKKIYSAIVLQVHSNPKNDVGIKEIISVLDGSPVVNSLQLELWEWISSYYHASLGEVSKAALPGGLRLESETRVFPMDGSDEMPVLPIEKSILQVLHQKPGLSLDEIASILKKDTVYAGVKSLLDKKLATANEQLNKGFQARTRLYLSLEPALHDPARQEELLQSLHRAPKQHALLSEFLSVWRSGSRSVARDEFLKSTGASSVLLNQLITKNILLQENRVESRLERAFATVQASSLNVSQEKALLEVKEEFSRKEVVLLHGVTSSGKTEIYIHLMREYITQGYQVLYLLPEIALTTQIIQRLQRIFGSRVGVYHSKFSDSERVETWKNLLEPDHPGSFQLILGVRSSLFLPFSKLGLIIVDEEHENTFKQFDPAPRYHARDTAVILARLHQARVLLGTATPSLESFFNHDLGKYGLVNLSERYLDIRMPGIEVVDLTLERKKKSMHSHFSPQLVQEIQLALEQKEQVILFQNRRGFSPYLQCESCGWVPVCKTCDVSLTWHKNQSRLVCHYCGTGYPHLHSCKSCGQSDLRTKGFGTEKIEDEISLLFPAARIARLDLDAARTRSAFERIIRDLEEGHTDILVGTQMVSKGLDFDKVRVVGILDADRLLNFPDFRAFERAFQLMEQVSGRAGRKDKQGKVIIQTSQPDHRIIRNLVRHDYLSMYRTELLERRKFNYPPFTRLIRITLKHRDTTHVDMAAERLATLLRLEFGAAITGPDSPLIGRIQNLFIRNILVKFERDKQSAQAKEKLFQMLDEFRAQPEFKGLGCSVDVDPM
ncbi:MAG: primosomal protein N' [Bacteroidales bacterium]